MNSEMYKAVGGSHFMQKYFLCLTAALKQNKLSKSTEKYKVTSNQTALVSALFVLSLSG